MSTTLNLQSLLDNVEVLTLCTLWQITRVDGTVFRFTDHDTSIVFESNTYTPANGVNASARQSQEGFRVNNLEFIGVLDADVITHDDLRAGLYRDAEVIEYMVNWKMPWMGPIQQSKYWVTEVRFTELGWEAQLAGLSVWLTHPTGNVYGRECRHVLGDASCGVDLSAIDDTGEVTAIVSSRLSFETDLSDVNGYFDFGVITWTSGNNDGLTSEVRFYLMADGLIVTSIKTPFDIQVGDTFTITPGCSKSIDQCISKYDNVINYGGFPFVPGTDKVFRTPYAK
ncbi:MAG: DUF2163 domain-containing protein [Blastochloris sp.]|nr:DUF2163 domain-containing protein [Blastochloris sp.]